MFTASLDAVERSVKARAIETDYADLKGVARALLGLSPPRSAHEIVGVDVARHGARRTLRQRCVELGFTLTTYPDA